ncbi:MAG: hypothetical protein ACI4FV_04260, partial [Lachnospiraceae bacterium]
YMIYALLKDRPVLAMILLGCAFSFKLQAVLILPVLVIYYWKNRRFSLLHFLIVPAVMEILCIPAILGGCSVFVPFSVYLRQLGRYPYLYVFYPNFWAFFREAPYYIFSSVSQLGIIAALGVFAVVVIRRTEKTDEKKWLLFLYWSVLLMMCFLPCMHERYGMLLEVIAILYAFLDRKCGLYAVIIGAGSYIAYLQVTFAKHIIDDRWIAFAYLLCLGMLTWHLVKTWKEPLFAKEALKKEELEEPEKETLSIKEDQNMIYRTTKVENTVIDFVNRHLFLIAYILLTVMAVWVRKPMIECMSPDYLPNLIEVEGNHHTTFYMTIMWFLTSCIEHIPFLQEKTLFFLVKLLCIGGDILAAMLMAHVCKMMSGERYKQEKGLIAYLLMLFLPSVFLNGVIWGHLDSLAVSLLLIAFIIQKKGHDMAAYIVLGFAWTLLGHYIIVIILSYACSRMDKDKKELNLGSGLPIAVLTGVLVSFLGMFCGYSMMQCMQKLFLWGMPETWMLYPFVNLLIFGCLRDVKWIPVMAVFQMAIILDYGTFLYENPILPAIAIVVCYVAAVVLSVRNLIWKS